MTDIPTAALRHNILTGATASRRWPERTLENLQRMVLVTGNYITAADGASLTLHRLVDTLTARGVQVAVAAPMKGRRELPPAPLMFDIPSIPSKQGYRIPLGLGRQARRQLEAFNPQLIHVASPDPASAMAVRFARRRGIPVISTFHTNFAAYLKYWWRVGDLLAPLAWKILGGLYARCDRVFVPTPSMGEELEGHGCLDEWSILARGVEPDSFGPQFRSAAWRHDLGIAPEDRVVLFCARIVMEKGLPTLVQALSKLREIERTRFVIVGDGEQLEWLRARLPFVIFTGFLHGDDLARAYASSDIFIYPSTTDTFGNVTLEAMASGLPVIGADAPGTKSLVADGRSGFLVPPEDPDAFAEATARLLRDDTLRARLSRGALARANEFRWPAILDDFVAELDALVA